MATEIDRTKRSLDFFMALDSKPLTRIVYLGLEMKTPKDDHRFL
jgi:hypothetical protein